MVFTLEALKDFYSHHIWIDLTNSDIEKAKSKSQNYSNQTGKNYAYKNFLVRTCFINWIQENLDIKQSQITVNCPEIWEFFTGSSVTFNNQKLILIPSDNLDIEEITIPQEWVDIPSFAGGYYLPVQIDLEAKYLHFWGYISRQSLKKNAKYDPIFHNYYLDSDYLIDELDLLEITLQVFQEKSEIISLPELSTQIKDSLMQKLSQVSRFSPRLEVDFQQWGALLNNQQWLKNLYQKRLETTLLPSFNDSLSISITNLIQGIFTENLLNFYDFLQQQKQVLIYLNELRLETVKVSLETVKEDNLDQKQRTIRELYQKQAEISLPSNLSPEEALIYLLENTNNQTILWECADYLQTINSNHPKNAIRIVMDLGLQLMGYPVALIVAVLPQPNQKVAIRLRVYPIRDALVLPGGINLVVFDENGQKIPTLEAISRQQDACIQLYFKADFGTRFGVSVSFQTARITEYFDV